MRILIRTLEGENTAAVAASDRVIDADVISFGRAPDQQIYCNDPRVALQHARFTRAGEALTISCTPPAQAEINGRLKPGASLRVGDEVSLGPMLIKVLKPPAGVDAAISVERDPREVVRADDAPMPHFALTLAEAGWRKRPWAWVAALATLLLCLAVPWYFVGQGKAALNGLRSSLAPSDLQWTSGPLHPAHANLEMSCESCHAEPFRRVRNEQCLDCHSTTLHQHVPANHPAAAEQRLARCTTCHVEHDEPSNLVQLDTRICSDCHAQPQDHGASARALPVTDFAAAHPDFQVSLLTAPQWTVTRVRLGEKQITETSNLKFTHAAHLDTKGIKAPQGEVVMQCADCHAPRDDGKGFLPVSMEPHCSTCHMLSFDPAEPERKLPHGEPALVMQTLVDHYSRRFLEGYADPLANRGPGRAAPPGASASAGARAQLLGRARDSANRMAADIFERRVCADCHAVTRSGPPNEPRWTVAPVRLTQTFMPKAHFDHAAHTIGETQCETCHAAAKSELASDVLMPQIAVCRDCHGGETGTEGGLVRTPSPCASCHVFHDRTEPRWVPANEKVLREAAVRPWSR
jgi:predicted CXXCH cytochrome family protein